MVKDAVTLAMPLSVMLVAVKVQDCGSVWAVEGTRPVKTARPPPSVIWDDCPAREHPLAEMAIVLAVDGVGTTRTASGGANATPFWVGVGLSAQSMCGDTGRSVFIGCG